RLEFIGDTIESLRTYDPSTQRSIASIDQVSVVPLRDILHDASTDRRNQAEAVGPATLDRSATLFDYLARTKDARIIVSERDEVEAQAGKLADQLQQSYANVIAGLKHSGARDGASGLRTGPT